jgi:hypothetical protein
MAVRTIIRGDSYGIRRPLYTLTLVDTNSAPFNLIGCTVRTTYKAITTDPTTDPQDSGAPIKHSITIALDGTVSAANGLVLVGAPEDGVLEERLTATESRLLPLNTELVSDVELTDQNGEVFTWLFTDTIKAIDGVTNRTT